MISQETRAQIRRYFYAEHWKIGTIARELGVHPDTVRNAIESERFRSMQPLRASLVDPYIAFLRQTLEQHPSLRATRLYQMIRDRGYSGGVVQLRRSVARLRPRHREAFLQLHAFAGEQAQVDWAHFGHVMVGRAKRAFLLCGNAVLFVGVGSRILLRSNDRYLPARPRSCLSSLFRPAASHPVPDVH